jgi:hypothetical protein
MFHQQASSNSLVLVWEIWAFDSSNSNTNRLEVLVGSMNVNNTCVAIGIDGGCIPTRTPAIFTSKAFAFNETQWVNDSSEYVPQIPFVTQYDLNSATKIDLFFEIIDTSGSGLLSIIANYSNPLTGTLAGPAQRINKVWTHRNGKWVGS